MQRSDILVITSYPSRGQIHAAKTVGIASYTKNTLLSLTKAFKHHNEPYSVTVLAEQLPGEESTYQEDEITVKRIWKRNSFTSFPTLLQEILQHPAKRIVIAFELSMFGNQMYLLPFPLFLLILKLLGKDVTIILHQVITDFNEMSGHINLKEQSLTVRILNFCVNAFYAIALLLSNRIIVFEQVLKERLSRFGNAHKVLVISHGVESFPHAITPAQAKSKLNIPERTYVVLSFGYLAWYKGTDLLIDLIKALPQDTRQKLKVIIAGGPNPNHVTKPFYQAYIADLQKRCTEEGILLTGFVEEKDILLYYQAADMILFPYRTCMSASGPLSMAFSFHKPFLVSEALAALFENPDMKNLLKESTIQKEDLIFSKQTFEEKLSQVLTHKTDQDARILFSKHLAALRNWDRIGEAYYDAIR